MEGRVDRSALWKGGGGTAAAGGSNAAKPRRSDPVAGLCNKSPQTEILADFRLWGGGVNNWFTMR